MYVRTDGAARVWNIQITFLMVNDDKIIYISVGPRFKLHPICSKHTSEKYGLPLKSYFSQFPLKTG
jgi:hypothetical protein